MTTTEVRQTGNHCIAMIDNLAQIIEAGEEGTPEKCFAEFNDHMLAEHMTPQELESRGPLSMSDMYAFMSLFATAGEEEQAFNLYELNDPKLIVAAFMAQWHSFQVSRDVANAETHKHKSSEFSRYVVEKLATGMLTQLVEELRREAAAKSGSAVLN